MPSSPPAVSPPTGTLQKNLILALAYALSGLLALRLAVQPGYATPIFPPAGIALSALIIFGPRLWPGVFLGALIVQLEVGLLLGVGAGNWWSVPLIALGALAQSMVGCWLSRRLLGFPNPLDQPGPIIRFLIVVAPLSCLVSVGVGIPVLVGLGLLPMHDAAFSAWNWWAGDTLGVLVMAPLAFVFFGQPREDWAGRRLGVSLPLLVALSLMVGLLTQFRDWENLRLQSHFNRDAEYLGSLVSRRFAIQEDMLRALERLMVVSPRVDAQAWREFITPWLERYPGSQNFAWAPWVSRGERHAFEARGQGVQKFHILDRDEQGKTRPAELADAYLPIAYVEPLVVNQSVLGLNELSLSATRNAVEQTRASGRPAVSEGFRLVQEQGSQRGVVAYLAVFDARQEILRGVVSGALRLDDLLQAVIPEERRWQVEVCLVDLDGRENNQRLAGPANCEVAAWRKGRLSYLHTMNFAGRSWGVLMLATPAYQQTLRGWATWAILGVGLGMMAVLGAFLLVSTGRHRRVRVLVGERTAQLADAGYRLEAQRALLAQAQRIAQLGSWELPPGEQVLNCSDELCRMLGLNGQQAIHLDDFLASVLREDRGALQDALEKCSREVTSVALDCKIGLEGQEERVAHFLLESEDSRTGLPLRLRGTVQDVTAVRRTEAHIQYLAHYDTLTGLPNRSHWVNRARAALFAAQRHKDVLAVLFLDLDHFKTVNDSLGHPVGDQLLSIVAQRLQSCLRDDDVLARQGGDEFVLLLPRLAHSSDAAGVARKLLDSLAEPVMIEGHELSVSSSIGIALHPADGSDVDVLLKHADIAMYSAKAAGRNNYQFFVPEMNVRAYERMMLENALRRALERQELVLHYQPQVSARDGRIVGCEALVRWRHPEQGLIAPDHFIAVAEDSGLIVPLGEWVLREACRQQVCWARAGRQLMVAVNISALQFRKEGFCELVEKILLETGADPQSMELEITETALMQPSEELVSRLQKLRDLGLTLALDDFGTGYSSLAYLKRLPITRLKLDRSFVVDLPHDLEDLAIASATLSMAFDLGMEVVAEGVENEAQQRYLIGRGCGVMQGFLFGHPLPPEAFECLLDEVAI